MFIRAKKWWFDKKIDMARRWQNQMEQKFHGKYSKTQTLSQSFQVWKMVLNEKFSLNSSTVVHSQNEFHPFFVALLFRLANIRHITFIICMNCSFFDFEHSFRVRISVRIYYLISFRFQLSIHFMIAFIPFSLVSISSLPLQCYFSTQFVLKNSMSFAGLPL